MLKAYTVLHPTEGYCQAQVHRPSSCRGILPGSGTLSFILQRDTAWLRCTIFHPTKGTARLRYTVLHPAEGYCQAQVHRPSSCRGILAGSGAASFILQRDTGRLRYSVLHPAEGYWQARVHRPSSCRVYCQAQVCYPSSCRGNSKAQVHCPLSGRVAPGSGTLGVLPCTN